MAGIRSEVWTQRLRNLCVHTSLRMSNIHNKHEKRSMEAVLGVHFGFNLEAFWFILSSFWAYFRLILRSFWGLPGHPGGLGAILGSLVFKSWKCYPKGNSCDPPWAPQSLPKMLKNWAKIDEKLKQICVVFLSHLRCLFYRFLVRFFIDFGVHVGSIFRSWALRCWM